MNDLEKAEIKQNKAIRGYIIRCLVKGYNNTALTRQLSNAMIAAGLIISPDISKYLDYLQEAGYIEFTEEKVTAYNAYANDAVIKLTRVIWHEEHNLIFLDGTWSLDGSKIIDAWQKTEVL